jgi:3'(2'), 5'-bisphosphate nucleotidase
MSANCDLASLGRAPALDELTNIISRAAGAIVAIDQSKARWRSKPDLSPVSAADEAANEVIMQGLSRLLPGVPVVSEEGARRDMPDARSTSFVLVDPLDGTREYLAGRYEFTVNIAIVVDGRPTIGLIAAPALGLIWRAVIGHGTERLRLPVGADAHLASEICVVHARRRPTTGFLATISRSHFEARTDAFLKQLPIAERVSCGSSLKFCRIAEGAVDIYARFAQTCEWDIAAGHAIVAAAAGVVTTPTGEELLYGRDVDFHVPGFIAWGDPEAAKNFFGRR